VFATARSDAAYVALAQLNKPYGLNELMYVTKFVRPPHGFVQFAIGRGVDYITLAGVTSGGLLAMANVASPSGVWGFSGWLTTMMPPPIPKHLKPIPPLLSVTQLTTAIGKLGPLTQ
jgi:hypothetical protein